VTRKKTEEPVLLKEYTGTMQRGMDIMLAFSLL